MYRRRYVRCYLYVFLSVCIFAKEELKIEEYVYDSYAEDLKKSRDKRKKKKKIQRENIEIM